MPKEMLTRSCLAFGIVFLWAGVLFLPQSAMSQAQQTPNASAVPSGGKDPARIVMAPSKSLRGNPRNSNMKAEIP